MIISEEPVGGPSGFDLIRASGGTKSRAVRLAHLTRLRAPPMFNCVMLGQSLADHVRIPGAGPTLSYETIGPTTDSPSASAITLLCLHGNSSHRGVWRPVARELREFRCVLLDFRGHGDSDHVSPPAYNPEHHAADLARVIRSVVKNPYVILAHSAGALAAARFITDTQSSAPVSNPVAFVWVDLDPLVPRWQVDYFHQGVPSVARTFPTVDDALRGFRRIYPNIPDERLRSFVIEGLRQVNGGWRMKLDPATYGTWEPGDLRPILPNIAPPTFVLRGAESIVTSAEGTAALSNGLPNREVREIKDGSHMLVLEHPEEVAAAVRDFIRRHIVSR
jgi:pimeloyl-ACP methyl ester carboxylesterase